MHDEWEWEDKGCSSFREWTEGEQPGNCTVHPTYTLAPDMQRFDCMSKAKLFCSRGKQKKTKSTQLLTLMLHLM